MSVGSSVPRVDGVAKVTGAARYLDDLDLGGSWHGATVRSQVAHAHLDGIDLDPAFDWTDVVVVTSQDITGHNVVHLIEDDQPALAPIGGRIMHVDEAIALVAAPTRARALEARKHVRARVRELPAVFTTDDALAANVKLYGDDNIFKRFTIRKGHAADAELDLVFGRAAHVIDGVYRTGAQEQMYIEPQAMASWWDGGTCHIVGSMQCPYYIHKGIKGLLAVDDDQIVITQSVTGGGFGGKEEYPSMIAAHAALLARKAQRSVKIVYDRDEDIAATTKRHPAVIRHRLALDSDGAPIAIDVDVVMDGGAYLTLSPVVLSRGVLHAAGPYRCATVRVTGRVVATNHPPHGAFRGFGAPQTTFPYERQIEKAARALGMGSLEYREKHALRLGDTTATGQVLDSSVGSDEVLAAIRRVAGPAPARDGVNAHGAPVKRGRGICFYFHGAGFTGSGEQRLAGRATVALTRDGHFEVRASSTDIGQGATTIFAQLCGSGLGIPAEDVIVLEPTTARVPDSGPTVASRTCMVVGGLVERAARALRERIQLWGRERGLHEPLSVVAAAMAAAQGELSETVQYEPPPGIHFDDVTYTGAAYPCYGWAACLVDLAVDLDTAEVTVERCVQAIDVGKAINPVIVKGQIEGGTLQALGWALLESVQYKDGRVTNANMTNCIVPTFADAPEMETIIVEVPYPHGPHGAKGVGEIPMDGPAAAVANALRDALGVELDELPILPETIAGALR
jgi:CO/xanthine dehydrogenase Mo-binding subunit